MIGALLLAAYAVSVLLAGRELGRERPRPNAILATMCAMIILSVFAGGFLTGGDL